MRIRLPLTLAIIDGFLVGVGQSSYVIPLDMVDGVHRTAQRQRSTPATSSYLNLRGEVLPYRRLREFSSARASRRAAKTSWWCAMPATRPAWWSTSLLGEFQTVIKPLGKVFSQVHGTGGFTILGSGDVALILDVPGLLTQVTQHANTRIAGQSNALRSTAQ